MKKLTLDEKIKKLENAINNARQKGLTEDSLIKITGNRPLRTMARSRNYERYLKVIKERYGVEQKVKKAKEKALDKQIKKIEKETGIKVTGMTPSKYGIPNKNILKMSLEEYTNYRLMVNDNDDNPLLESTIRQYSKRDYMDIKDKARKLNANNINRESISYSDNFLDRYFLNAPIGNYNIQTIKEYMKYLSVQKRYDILDLIQSDKFKKVYDSDDENIGFDSSLGAGERAELRQEQLLKILRNETGLVINYKNGDFETKESGARKNSNTISSYLD